MAEESRMQRCAEDDPNRCHANNGRGEQCVFLSVENSDYCVQHGGQAQENKNKAQGLRNLRLTFAKARARMDQMADSDGIKSLQDEISVLRYMLETTMNRCSDDTELMLQSSVISDLVMKIDKVVTSCHRLDTSLSNTLDKGAILRIAGTFIDTTVACLNDSSLSEEEAAAIAEAIAEKVIPTVTEATNGDDE